MATFSFDVVDDAVPRILKAFGKRDPLDPLNWIDATQDEVEEELKRRTQEHTINFETAVINDVQRASKSQEVW